MKPNEIRIPWAWAGCWIACFAVLAGCQIGKPRFSTTSSVSLTRIREGESPAGQSSPVALASHVIERGPRSIGDSHSNSRSGRSSIQLVALDSAPALAPVGGGDDLFESDSETWFSRPPRLVAAESQSLFDPEEGLREQPFPEPLPEPVEIDESTPVFASSGFSLKEDACDLFPMLRDDVCSIFTWKNAIILGAGVGGALAVRESLDGNVRDYTLRHRQLWGEGSQVMRQFGEFAWQVPVMAGIYGWGLWTQDEWTHEFSKALISAYAITSITTVSIKAVTNTDRPTTQFQDGHYGFPSFHTASTFSMAAVIDEYYGWPAGVPAYVLAGLVGWSRIDQREHDLSDVLFGSLLGFVIGKSIAKAHLDRYGNHEIVPYYDPATKTVGALFTWRF